MKYVFIGVAIILAIFLIILIQIPKGIEPLTEMYFENHAKLPKYLFLNKPYNFSFTIHNLEYTNMEYEYVINVGNETGEILSELDRKNISLSDNETITIYKEFSFNNHFERSKINIQLNKITSSNKINAQRKFWWEDPNYPETINIHFWIEEITGPKITITPD